MIPSICGFYKKLLKWIYLQNKLTDTENKLIMTKKGKEDDG